MCEDKTGASCGDSRSSSSSGSGGSNVSAVDGDDADGDNCSQLRSKYRSSYTSLPVVEDCCSCLMHFSQAGVRKNSWTKFLFKSNFRF